MVSMGECHLGLTTLGLGRRAGVPSLALDAQPCGRYYDNTLALPVHRVEVRIIAVAVSVVVVVALVALMIMV